MGISSRGEAGAGELTFSGDSWTSRSEPTDISALGQEPAAQSNQGLKQRRRSSAGGKLKSNEQKEQAKEGAHKRKAGDGKQKSGQGKKKSKTDEEEQKKKQKKGKRKFKITDYMKRRGIVNTDLKPNNHFNSTNSLVSSVANSILSNSLEKSKGKQQLKVTSPVEGAGEAGRPLENALGCGIPRPGSNNQQSSWPPGR